MDEFKALFKYPPKNAWNALLAQLFCWSFRRFCVERLGEEPSTDLWDSLLTLTSDYAPSQLKPHLDHWMAPEQIAHVANLRELDTFFRTTVMKLDKSIVEQDIALQDALSTFFDEELYRVLETWLGPVYAPFSLFPSPTEPDTDIDLTKLNAIIYLLGRQPSLERTKRKTLRLRRAVTPIKTQIRKTRHSKQKQSTNDKARALQLQLSSDSRGGNTRGPQAQDNTGECEKREGDKEYPVEEQRNGKSQDSSAHKDGSSEHPQPPVHAESVQQHSSTESAAGQNTENTAPKKEGQ